MTLPIEIFLSTTNIIGEILIAVAVIVVHHRMIKERKIDRVVLSEMKHEQLIAIFGIVLIVSSFLADVIIKLMYS